MLYIRDFHNASFLIQSLELSVFAIRKDFRKRLGACVCLHFFHFLSIFYFFAERYDANYEENFFPVIGFTCGKAADLSYHEDNYFLVECSARVAVATSPLVLNSNEI